MTDRLQPLTIIKIGGNIIDDDMRLSDFLRDFANITTPKILIHGGGKMATQIATQLGLPQTLINGRRITDAESLKVVTMVYAGYINKNIVALLQGNGCTAIGASGADADLVRAHKRTGSEVDYGFAGDVDTVNSNWLQTQLEQGYSPVIAPITHDGKGQLLNTNADTMAQEIAQAMSGCYATTLVYAFEKPGVLESVEDDNSLIPVLTPSLYHTLKENNKIFSGMIPKLDNAFAALQKGVSKVIIGQAEQLPLLLNGTTGTHIVYDS
jgi:acetylglutamate kinase